MAGGGEQLPDCGKIVLWDGIPWNWDWEAAPTRNRDRQHPCQPRVRLGSKICSIPKVLDRAWINLVKGVPAGGWKGMILRPLPTQTRL